MQFTFKFTLIYHLIYHLIYIDFNQPPSNTWTFCESKHVTTIAVMNFTNHTAYLFIHIVYSSGISPADWGGIDGRNIPSLS